MALVITNGHCPDSTQFADLHLASNTLVCTDGGVRHARKLSVVPDVILGDFDSVSRQDLLRYSDTAEIARIEAQDTTDTEKAIIFLRNRNYRRIHIMGVDGDRTDHFVYHLELLLKFKDINITLWGLTEKIYVVQDSIAWEGKSGTRLSFFVFGKPLRIDSYGLRYNLKQEEIFFGKTSSISNTIEKDRAGIHLQNRGDLFVFESF